MAKKVLEIHDHGPRVRVVGRAKRGTRRATRACARR
jgi:hypothetical protein